MTLRKEALGSHSDMFSHRQRGLAENSVLRPASSPPTQILGQGPTVDPPTLAGPAACLRPDSPPPTPRLSPDQGRNYPQKQIRIFNGFTLQEFVLIGKCIRSFGNTNCCDISSFCKELCGALCMRRNRWHQSPRLGRWHVGDQMDT